MSRKTARNHSKSAETERLVRIINPRFYYYGRFFGYAHSARACKICQSDKRDIIEMMLRNPEVNYRDIIEFDDSSPEPLFLNKANLSVHASKHMAQDDLIFVQIAPDGKKADYLMPRFRVLQTPHFVEDGKIIVSKCSLGYCGCEWLQAEGKKYLCTYQGRCPLKEESLESHLSNKEDSTNL